MKVVKVIALAPNNLKSKNLPAALKKKMNPQVGIAQN